MAHERRLGVLQLRKPVGEVGLLDRIVDIDERRAHFDVVARLEMFRGHHAGRLRRDDDALIGAQRADRRQLRRPFLDFDRLGGHRRRLRRERRSHESLDHGGLDGELEIGEPAGHGGQQSQHNQEHDRPASAKRKVAKHEQQRQYCGARDEDERGNGSVNERKLRPRAERKQREREQSQEPVRRAPHRSIPVGRVFRPRLLQHFAQD